MLGTLFFDETDTTSALHVRPNPQHHAENVNVNGVAIRGLATRHAPCFPTSGSIPVFSLRATLLWWLDRDMAMVHLMLTSSTPGDVSYSCRKMSVDISAPRSAVIACGVTHIREETVFAVTWVTSLLEVGILRVQLQRSSDSQSYLLIVPDGKVVLTSRPQRVIEAFENDAKMGKYTNEGEKKDAGESAGVENFPLSACILARLPFQATPSNLLSMIFFTNGVSLWKIEVGEDGTFTELDISLSKGCVDSTTTPSRCSSISSWLPLWSWDNNRDDGQQYAYASVSAVQETQFIALQGSNGVLELYDTAASFLTPIFSCLLWEDEDIPCGKVNQWVELINEHIHVLTCIGSEETCRCIWLRIPFTTTGDGFFVAERVLVVPSAASSTLLGCVVMDTDILALLWDVGSEEDACISPPISIGSLLHSTQQNFSGVLQIITTEGNKKNEAGYWGNKEFYASSARDVASMNKKAEAKKRHTAIVSMFLKNTEIFFCHSGPLHALTSVGSELVLIENVNGSVRAHVLSSEMNPLEYLTEVSFAVSRPITSLTSNSLLLCSIHLIPAVVSVDDRPVSRDTVAFEEGVELAASCADGADNFAALLISAVQNVSVALSAGGFRLLCSSAYLQGYTPSGFVDEITMNVALKDIVTYVDVPARTTSFCSFSRRFVQHTISRDLLSRIAYLLCSYLGWMGSRMESLAVMELPRFRIFLEFLSAAYHVVSVAGPHVASIASVVKETVIEDVIQFFLSFKNELKEEKSHDALFAVHVARRLQECGGIVWMRACATWCNLLCRRYPSLQHFRIVRDLEAGRITNSSLFASMCLAASFHLASLPQESSVLLLLEGGLDISSRRPLLSVFDGVDTNEWRALLGNTSLVAKTYRVALLRFVIPSCDTHYTSMSGSLVRELFLIELVGLEQYMRLSGLESSRLYRALLELLLDTHMFLARTALDESTLGEVFHSLEKVLRRAEELNMTPKYLEQVLSIVARVVELAAVSQEHTDTLVNVTHSSTELDNILASKWNIYIARLATKVDSQDAHALLMRVVLGLYRFLCRRHAYGQAARMMTDLANVVRCSASCSSNTVEAVLEMTALAVTAAELIAPTAPLQVNEEDREETLALAVYDFASYLHAQEQTTSKAPLTREHLPWLRRRHFQAFCEKKLVDAKRRVDCTDLWAENPSPGAHAAAVKRFVEALMESHFWTEARCFAVMSGYDAALVFQEHVVDLLASTDYSTDDVALQEWRDMIQECEALSSSTNRFEPLRRTLIAAFMHDFKRTHPALLNSLERMNRYVAMQALLEVFETLMHRQTEVWRADAAMEEYDEEEVAANGARSSPALSRNSNCVKKQRCGDFASSSVQVCFPLVEALRIGTDVLTGCLHKKEENGELIDAPMTAGLFDPLACRARELLDSSLLLKQSGATQAIVVAKKFLEAFDALKREKLAIM